MSREGSIFVEGSIVLFTFVLATLLSLELVRRSWYMSVGHYAAFAAARKRALGTGDHEVQAWVTKLYVEAFGRGRHHVDGLQVRPAKTGEELTLWHRYPAFLRFPFDKHSKHHFEQTTTCLFPLAF